MAADRRWHRTYVIALAAVIGGALAYALVDWGGWTRATYDPYRDRWSWRGGATPTIGINYYGGLLWGLGGALVGGAPSNNTYQGCYGSLSRKNPQLRRCQRNRDGRLHTRPDRSIRLSYGIRCVVATAKAGLDCSRWLTIQGTTCFGLGSHAQSQSITTFRESRHPNQPYSPLFQSPWF